MWPSNCKRPATAFFGGSCTATFSVARSTMLTPDTPPIQRRSASTAIAVTAPGTPSVILCVQLKVDVAASICQHLTVLSELPERSTCWCVSRHATLFVCPTRIASLPDLAKPRIWPSPRPQNSHSPALIRHQHTSPSWTSISMCNSKRPAVFLCGFQRLRSLSREAVYMQSSAMTIAMIASAWALWTSWWRNMPSSRTSCVTGGWTSCLPLFRFDDFDAGAGLPLPRPGRPPRSCFSFPGFRTIPGVPCGCRPLACPPLPPLPPPPLPARPRLDAAIGLTGRSQPGFAWRGLIGPAQPHRTCQEP
mmetsp:Transcript_42450/g.109599  ORF Transcript_42450/g.109599 Transcript_42450/m.109599 type:complete len:305 (+) Transcript_42450:31-945(+)